MKESLFHYIYIYNVWRVFVLRDWRQSHCLLTRYLPRLSYSFKLWYKLIYWCGIDDDKIPSLNLTVSTLWFYFTLFSRNHVSVYTSPLSSEIVSGAASIISDTRLQTKEPSYYNYKSFYRKHVPRKEFPMGHLQNPTKVEVNSQHHQCDLNWGRHWN